MAVMDNTAYNAVIDEKWDSDVDEGRYAGAVIMPRVLNKSGLVKKSGDIINLTYRAKYTAGTVTAATGAFTPQQLTLTPVAVTVDQWYQVAVESTDKAEAQSLWSIDSTFASDAGKAMGEQIDTQLANLHSSITTNIVGVEANPGSFTDSEARSAMLLLADGNIPKNDLSWILPPIAFYMGIAAQPQFTEADKTGFGKNVLTTNYRFPLLGAPCYESTLVATVNGNCRKGFLLHKSCLAAAMQKNNEIQRASGVAAGKFSYITALQSLFGVKVFREDHGVVINIAKS